MVMQKMETLRTYLLLNTPTQILQMQVQIDVIKSAQTQNIQTTMAQTWLNMIVPMTWKILTQIQDERKNQVMKMRK